MSNGATIGIETRAYKWVKTVLLLSVLVIVLLVFAVSPIALGFKQLAATDVANIMAPLILIALFIERALEVAMTAWRAERSAQLEETTKISDQQDAVAGKNELLRYRAQTQRIAFLGGLAMGVVISALGVRALEYVVDATPLTMAPGMQLSLFRGCDVLITGAVLGGGADGIHKITSVFTTFLEKTAKNVKQSSDG